MSKRVVKRDDAAIATEAFGDPSHPSVLLIMGAMASMLWWPEELCQRLTDQRRYVIRYDNRDTGLSSKYAPGEPRYTFDDMVDDAVRILDAYRISSAHFVGMSMGGMAAQIAALKYPRRVASLTVISSSPLGTDTSHLPQATEAYREHSAKGAKVDWTDRTQVIDFMVQDSCMIAGTVHPFDEPRTRAFIEDDYDRAGGLASATNHFLLKGGDGWEGRLSELQAPLLVIHGTADPLFPVEHGAALAGAVSGARLVRIKGGGHELHPEDWDEIIAAIADHTGGKS